LLRGKPQEYNLSLCCSRC